MFRIYVCLSTRALLASDITVVVSCNKGEESQAHIHDYYVISNKSNINK